jgi:hypothetical protein
MSYEDTETAEMELEGELEQEYDADSVDDSSIVSDPLLESEEEWIEEHVDEIGTIAAAHSDKLTLRKMIESDAEMDRTVRRHGRAEMTIFSSHVGLLVYDFVTGGLLTWESTDLLEWIAMSGWMSAKGAQYFEKEKDVFTEGPVGDYTMVPRGERHVVEELLDESDAVLCEKDGYEGEMSGEEAVDHYGQVLELEEAGYDDIVEQFEDVGSEEAEAFMERQLGEDLMADVKANTLIPVVRFTDLGRHDEEDYTYQLELYAADELVATYQGLASTSTKQSVEIAGKRLGYMVEEYERIADEMEWDDLKPGTDSYDDSTVAGYLHDTVASIRDAAYWAGSMAKEKVR